MFDVNFNPLASSLNSFTTYVMDSSAKSDMVIKSFEEAFSAGLCSMDALNYALKENKISMNEFTMVDQNKINRRIKAIEKSSFNRERRF